MPFTPRASARAGAVVAIGALVSSTLVLAPSAVAATRVLTEADVDLSYSRLQGSNTFLSDGVRIEAFGQPTASPDQRKAAGYFDVAYELAEVGEPTMDYTRTSGALPSIQLVVDLDGDGTEDGTLVGETVYEGDWWLPGSSVDGVPVDPELRALAPKEGGGGSADNGTLDQWRAAFPDAEVTRAGWSLGSGVNGKGVIHAISIDGDDYYFAAGERTRVTLYESDVAQRDTRTQGRNTFRPTGGVRIQTFGAGGSPDQRKATGYFAVNTPLADAGEVDWDYRRISGGEPGKQLIVDLDGDVTTTDDRGILVGESVYDGIWWATNSSSAAVRTAAPRNGGGYGSDFFGSLNEWRQAMPDALVLEAGWSLGSGVLGDGVLSSITVGTTIYSFSGANRAPSAPDATATTRLGTSVVVDLTGTDADGDAITYAVESVTGGTATVAGDELTFTPAANRVGAASVTYSATDARGASSTGTVSITVRKALPVLTGLTGQVRSDGYVFVVGPVTSAAGSPNTAAGSAVTITRAGATLGSGRVANGRLVDRVNAGTRPGILIGRNFAKGRTFPVLVNYPGSSTVEAGSIRVQVTIPR